MPYIEESGETLEKMINFAKTFSSKLSSNKSTAYSGPGLNRSSIMRASKDLVMSFPVLCSNTLSPSTASMISKAVERNCVTTLQLLFSSAYLQGPDGQSVLKQWHRNMDSDIGMDEYLDIADALTSTLTKEHGLIAEELKNTFLSEQTRFPLSSFSESSIQNFSIDTRRGKIDVYMEAIYDYDDFVYGADDESLKRMRFMMDRDNLKRDADLRQQQINNQKINNDAINRRQGEMNDHKVRYDELNYQLAKDKENRMKQSDERQAQMQSLSDRRDFFKRQLLDSDVKKVNELVPSMIIVRFAVADPTDPKNIRGEKEFIAGVKTRLIPCDSFEIIDQIRAINKNKVSLVNFIRATTKEISLSRDFVMAIDQAKIDAKKNSRISQTSPIWRSLQNRSTKSVMSRLKKNRANDAGAITTLVLSDEEVNMLKKEYNIDLHNPSKAKFVMEQFNLMCFITVNEEVEVARFLMDGEKYFQDYSFSDLERETGDGSYKKVVNLISKINRG